MKRFERSNGLDTALYRNYLYLFSGNVSAQFSCNNCSVAECLPDKSNRCRNEQVSQGVNCKAL